MQESNVLDRWDRDNLLHPVTNLARHAHGESPTRVMATGSGAYVLDSDGNRLLDAFAGLFCVTAGYGRAEIIDAMAVQAKELAYYHAYAGHGTEASIRLAKMIIDRAPAKMSKVFFGLGGSDANDTNVKLAWLYNNIRGRPRKKKIISRWRGYHGSGLMSGSLTGLELFHKRFGLPLAGVLHTVAPYYYRRADAAMSEEEFTADCAAELEALVAREDPDTIAAFIGEPMMGTGGIIPPPKGYWAGIQPILKKHDILLIADEVVTGFGRLGSMFGSDQYAIKPDLMTIAKGLTSAYAPLSASIVSEGVWKVLEQDESDEPFGHGWTYSAHPVCVAAGIANLELTDRLGLVANARQTGDYLKSGIADALQDCAVVGEVRGEGMMCAVEFVGPGTGGNLVNPAESISARTAAELLDQGVIARVMPQGDILGFAPPLCLTREEADEIVGKTAQAIARVGRTTV